MCVQIYSIVVYHSSILLDSSITTKLSNNIHLLLPSNAITISTTVSSPEDNYGDPVSNIPSGIMNGTVDSLLPWRLGREYRNRREIEGFGRRG